VSIRQVKVNVNEVTVGMFIAGLDRPWSQTPFPIQGFYIRNLDEIKSLKAYCSYVFIDVFKGVGPVATNLRQLGGQPKNAARGHSLANIVTAPIQVKPNIYTHYEPLKKEIKRAQQLHQKVFRSVREVMSQLNDGATASLQEVRRSAGEMVDSIVRNPDAFTWLSRIRGIDEHTYAHAVRSAVWSLVYGRHIGLDKKELHILAMGVLLKDIGKTALPQNLVITTSQTAQQQTEYETFVEKGVAILRQFPDIEPKVISVVKTHRERIDGSGFLQHLQGDKIPLLGKIAGIVTYYDSITNPRDATRPVSPSKAVARLYEVRDIEFQEDLVVEFIRAIGLYPTGTLVELSSGEVGVVVEQNFKRRLKPKVMLVMDSLKQPLKKPILLDLAEDDRVKQSLIDSGQKTPDEVDKISIVQDLKPGSYAIDISKMTADYSFKSAKKGLFSFFKC
jgi:HD-GYP domain-containing protein (c-di-GMP phosphodiesterase class II)